MRRRHVRKLALRRLGRIVLCELHGEGVGCTLTAGEAGEAQKSHKEHMLPHKHQPKGLPWAFGPSRNSTVPLEDLSDTQLAGRGQLTQLHNYRQGAFCPFPSSLGAYLRQHTPKNVTPSATGASRTTKLIPKAHFA